MHLYVTSTLPIIPTLMCETLQTSETFNNRKVACADRFYLDDNYALSL